MAIGSAQAAVKNGHARESCLETPHGLGREGDFGNQHQRLLSAGDDAADALQINFRLAAAGDAVQEVHGKAPVLAADKFVEDLLLIFIEGNVRLIRLALAKARRQSGKVGFLGDGDPFQLSQFFNGGRRRAGFGG